MEAFQRELAEAALRAQTGDYEGGASPADYGIPQMA